MTALLELLLWAGVIVPGLAVGSHFGALEGVAVSLAMFALVKTKR